MIGETASGLDERLGEEYGDYARAPASAIEDTASSLAAKTRTRLIDDTRNFVRKSPAWRWPAQRSSASRSRGWSRAASRRR
jgi:hypothetical protein